MRHRLQSDLTLTEMKEAGSILKTPAGFLIGWGTTVGNGIEGWAPGASFTETDATTGQEVWINTGTKITASWTRDIALLDGESLTLADDASVIFGDDSDKRFKWNNTAQFLYLMEGAASGQWQNIPLNMLSQRSKFHTFYDEFYPGKDTPGNQTTVCTYVSTDDGGTGTNDFDDTGNSVRGIFQVVTAAADDDYHLMSTPEKFADLGHIQWFEALVKLTEANDDDANWIVGTSAILTDGLLKPSGGGPPDSYDGMCFYKVDGGTDIHFEYSNGGSQTADQTWPFTSGAWHRLGWYHDNTLVTPYVDGVAGTAVVAQASGHDPGYLVFGVKAGDNNAETLQIDFLSNTGKRA